MDTLEKWENMGKPDNTSDLFEPQSRLLEMGKIKHNFHGEGAAHILQWNLKKQLGVQVCRLLLT